MLNSIPAINRPSALTSKPNLRPSVTLKSAMIFGKPQMVRPASSVNT
ncbi:Uncharacterised protein [Mycobacterium tuberculosis]|uniref:Uncharacterized protein n=1 Tax=Mycobacterium tuberculosis TaxID=1773 RepID=A0A0T7PCT4_MYCTX|nr:Uncharacterised protein [Mycobacterium tuberculosis]CKT72166.1 Uncharacterised protein [Mycobacterium tuberculosis]CNV40507.1 Uncharacterised protein [Mycobacterium tuberculosis]COW89533.1 Uncharacterised protein [Mycobacterium tuberculosis]COX29499.1 Uncharacterised protein [Mycobacterium tuberculosis]